MKKDLTIEELVYKVTGISSSKLNEKLSPIFDQYFAQIRPLFYELHEFENFQAIHNEYLSDEIDFIKIL